MKLSDRLLLALLTRRLVRDQGFMFVAAVNNLLHQHLARRSAEVGGVEKQLAIHQAWRAESAQRVQ